MVLQKQENRLTLAQANLNQQRPAIALHGVHKGLKSSAKHGKKTVKFHIFSITRLFELMSTTTGRIALRATNRTTSRAASKAAGRAAGGAASRTTSRTTGGENFVRKFS